MRSKCSMGRPRVQVDQDTNKVQIYGETVEKGNWANRFNLDILDF